MENEKPKDVLKAKALSHIPFDVQLSMSKQMAVDESDLKALQEKVLKHGPALQANPSSIVPKLHPSERLPDETSTVPVPQSGSLALPAAVPAFISYAINGHVINVPTDEAGAAIMMFYTLLTFVWSKDKDVAKILKQFDFKFFDSNKQQIYPKLKRGKK
ncbi:MAG: hypothetical protein ACREBR_05285 [bacterium]